MTLTFAAAQDRPAARDIYEDDHQAERLEWFYSQRRYPSNSIPPGARRNAILEINRMDAAARAQRRAARASVQGNVPFALTTDSANWTMIGPKPTDPSTAFTTSGRISAIVVDPRDNNVVYAGAAEGGVWKSTDGGVNWKPLTDDQVSLAIGSMALDPQNPDTIYVGTGEGNFNSDGYYGAGILKSTDGGATWTNILGPFLRDYIGAIGVHPTNSQIVICASRLGGIWRSADGGNTWTATLTGASGTSIAFDPTNGDSIYAALGTISGSTRNGVYHSTDAGQTWQRVTGTGNAALPATGVGRIEIAVAPSAPATVFAQIANTITSGTSSATLMGIYKTTDAGTTWTRVTSTITSWGSQMWYYSIIRVSPQDPNVIWSGGISIVRSVDGGNTWIAPSSTGPNGSNIHVDVHAFAFTPDGSKLYIGNDGGMYSTTDIAAARPNWTNLNATLAITQFYPGMSMDPGMSGVAIVGAQDNGTQGFDGQGTWQNLGSCGDGGFTALDPSFPFLALVACQNIAIERAVFQNSNLVWNPAAYGIDPTDPTQFISPLAIDPSNPQTVYFGTYRVWQSRDSGGVWTASPDLTGGKKGTLKAIAIAPSDSNTVYAGTNNSKVQVTTEALKGASATWTDRSAGLPARTVTRIAVDPLNAATAYVTFSGFPAASDLQGHIYKTASTGASWTDISGNLPVIPVNDVIVDPDLPSTLYIGTDAGVMITTDGGNSWSSLGNGLPKVVVTALVLNRHARVLRAGTHGRSVWEIAVPLSAPTLQPHIDQLTPATVDAGSEAFVLSAAGANFVPATTIRWNGQDRATTFVDAGHVRAQISADDVSTLGRAAVLAFNPSTGGGASTPVNFNIGGAPRTTTAAFVNAANPSAGNAVAPRSIASIYGTNLASSVVVAGAPPLPFTLAGTMVTSGVNSVPLFFVSPGQINVQVPLVGAPSTQSLTIAQGVQSVTVSVQLKAYAPGIFATNGQGTGQASAVIANTATLAAPAGTTADSRPAKPGEYISIYCTGLGDTSPRPTLGSPSPSNPPAITLLTPTVMIGNVAATVQFSGLAPGFVGLNQVNVLVPSGVTAGDAVPVVILIGGATSNTATIAVGQ